MGNPLQTATAKASADKPIEINNNSKKFNINSPYVHLFYLVQVYTV